MDWSLLVILQVIFQPTLSVLFTVEAEQTSYKSEFGESVVMGCMFNPEPSQSILNLTVAWHRIKPSSEQDVIRIDNGMEHAASQMYEGRVRLLTDHLKKGWAKLQISKLRINDSGTYRCLVHTEKGADYKTISLSVVAPYKTVTKRLEKASERDQVVLTCQAEGYPKASVLWTDGLLQRLDSNTTAESTPDQLFKVTSHIRVSSSEKNNFTCRFTDDGSSATFHIPEEIPAPRATNVLIIVLTLGVIILVMSAGVLAYRRRKGLNVLLAGGGDRCYVSPAAARLQIDQENEDEIITVKDGAAL